MAKTIGNPLSWLAGTASSAGAHLALVGNELAGTESRALPQARKITYGDLKAALRSGAEDFAIFRTDVAVLCVLYPVIGLLLAWAAFDRNFLPLLFPLISGFALIGPVAAVGMYEMSRKRELGQSKGWGDAFGVLQSPAFGAILALGLMLTALFAAWLIVAEMIFVATMGPDVPVSAMAFARDVLGTSGGRWMIVLGIAAGFCFAGVVLVATLVSFPLLIDRHVGVPVAVATSIAVARLNPGPVAAWGLIVAALLLAGSLPLFLGLILVMPLLGHATWHLYRRAVLPG